MFAVLDKSQPDIGPGDDIEQVERVPPRHIGILAAVKDSDRQIERRRFPFEQVLFSILEDAVAFNGGAGGRRQTPPHESRHVPGWRDQNHALRQRSALARQTPGEKKRDPGAHARSHEDSRVPWPERRRIDRSRFVKPCADCAILKTSARTAMA